jgi:hypothetical protein
MPNGLPPDVIDDLSIQNDELLYIRIYPDPDAIILDPTTGQYRPNSGNFKDRDGPLSVDLSSRCTPEETRDRDQSHPYHVAAFKAGAARKYGCKIVRDPLEATPTEPANPAHALLYGKSINGALTYKAQGRHIAKEEAWIVLRNDGASLTPQGTDKT